ncbi:NAD(P)H-dependent oxidoreductase [Treponema phagedenis]|uniref:NAD(P)H-dependent oxidoreductase n=1 Tax=Treponema phagedenis TaxID=162 RepID=A0A0B7GUS3_TREPH|nr:NAD(P)H-dependent oxidoreductase [Treponema phagedenis]EFW38181.1 nitroreductase family protein [Treponema phagedenis F0421]NVP24674.1 NAD(P)H-dependent oxidoreductase [Treponema phagedenis]QEJ95693.1 NAD(P)H-dependent oxidoreductase [Treponema phagedenis]QEJ97577.1 NAD(P)H-dependent oxidoreductase [Treponema phagedenis]QEK00543.1 NAD(P)H-dependent oxidoreductase [Treponema phagedenis]
MIDKKTLLAVFQNRYACKKFDSSKKIPKDEADFILEAARLSPSSFGLEGWQFVAVYSDELLRKKIGEACFAQDNVFTSSLIVVSLCKAAKAYAPESAFVRQRAERFPDELAAFLADYRGYHGYLHSAGRLDEWSRAQTYICCANMMTAATACGIQSCAIEGFINDEVLTILNYSAEEWNVGIITVFGYAAGDNFEPRKKIREPKESIITWR